MTTATYTRFDAEQVSNGAQAAIDTTLPYRIEVSIRGIAPLLMHRWNTEAVEEKAKAGKNTTAKKTDNVESYVYRDEDGRLCVPGTSFCAALIEAGRYMQDPRSPRKSLRDLCRAGIVPLTLLAPFEPHTTVWDYEDRQRVTVQRAGITRTRPAMRAGWQLSFDLLVNTPEYFPPETVAQLVASAGRLVGLCDFRPTYGRFAVTGMVTRTA